MRNRLLFISLLLALLVIPANSFAQQITAKHLTVENGLSSPLVRTIAEDSSGFIWFGTGHGLSRFDGYQIQSNFGLEQPFASDQVQALHLDQKQNLWVGSLNSGLVRYSAGLFEKVQISSNAKQADYDRIFAITSDQSSVWLGTAAGLFVKAYDEKEFTLVQGWLSIQEDITTPLAVRSLLLLGDDNLLVGTRNGLYLYQKHNKSLIKINIDFTNSSHTVRALAIAPNDSLLLGTDDGLYQYPLTVLNLSIKDPSQVLKQSPVIKDRILDISVNAKYSLIGTAQSGLIKIGPSGKLEFFNHNPKDPYSLSDNFIFSVFEDSASNIWLGTFNSGVNFINSYSFQFQRYAQTPLLDCLRNLKIHSIKQMDNLDMYLGTIEGFYKIDGQSKQCSEVQLTSEVDGSVNNNITVFSIHQKSSERLLLGTQLGLFEYNIEKKSVVNYLKNFSNKSIYTIEVISPGNYLLATNYGLYQYKLGDDMAHNVTFDGFSESNSRINDIASLPNKQLIFATNLGVAILSAENKLVPFKPDNQLLQQKVMALWVDDSIWVGGDTNQLHRFDLSGNLLGSYSLLSDSDNFYVVAIVADEQNNLWITSNKGLFRFDKSSKTISRFQKEEGLQGDIFELGVAIKSVDGQLFFGNRNGLTSVDPDELSIKTNPPKVALSNFTRLNNEVLVGVDYDGFSIDDDIQNLSQLEIGHKDYMINFEFTALDYAAASRNQYAYMLEGFHNQWNYVDAKNRIATFTNLPAGSYVFKVKSANKDGRWSEAENSEALPIKVKPAPWLSWWAFSLYALLLIIAVLLIIAKRTKDTILRAKQLELEVENRTQEIQNQKLVIESLLQRKDELFANISHEFRTPLTLITGPLQKLMSEMKSSKHSKLLTMMRRNANRLLSMVEQILQLTELSKQRPIEKKPLAVEPVLQSIVESFQAFADNKSIKLTLDSNVPATIMASHDALEVIVGNLISNAIKYTKVGGKVTVHSVRRDKDLVIVVEDSGYGMNEQQQKNIFDRFVRLDATSDIAGTGIGLSIVKELLESHEGRIIVSSELGVGSRFEVCLPTSEQLVSSLTSRLNAIEHLIYTDYANDEPVAIVPSMAVDDGNKQETILIIDDNQDMQQYIKSCLGFYNCLVAERGEKGLQIAVDEVPDLILCDIMMPGIDGYEVAKRIRSNLVTSHIPIILLTAKGDQQSRIQGWREHIDDYMTKPFAQEELALRVENLLSIRNILKKNAGEQLFEVAPKGSVEKGSLNKLEQQFLDSLYKNIESNYSKSNYSRADMASAVALSERQFQRKLKAFINKTPVEFLREYRLQKAKQLLMDGFQVSIVSDQCGFSSVSYFSSCFKASYGVSPKKYQQQH